MGDALDEKSLSFLESDDELPPSRSSATVLDELDGVWGIDPPKAMLQAPTASERPPTRSGSCRAAFTGSASPALGVSSPGQLFSPPTRRLPDIALDLSPSPAGSLTAGSHHSPALALPATSSSPLPETKKKPFMMASLAIGLNEVIQLDDMSDEDESRLHAPAKNGGGRTPKKYQLGLPPRSASPTHALASPKSGSPTPSSSSSPTSGGSKLVPIGGGGNSHSLLKFDAIVSGVKSTDDMGGARPDPPPSYRKTIASRSPLRDRSMLSTEPDPHTAPSKLEPLDAESIRCSSLTSSLATTTVISTSTATLERKSLRLPLNSRLETPDSKSTPSSPDKLPPSQPMFRNPFKKQPAAGSSPSRDEKKSCCNGDDGEEEQGSDLVVGGGGGSSHASPGRGSNAGGSAAPALTPQDEFNYLLFSPRVTGASSSPATAAGKQRDLPSLSLSSDAKDVQPPRKAAKLRQQQEKERATAK